MADGTLSMAEGLGFKAVDSNELRRKQVPHVESPKSGVPFTLNPQGLSISGDTDLQSSRTRSVQSSTPNGFGAHSPKSSKNTSPAHKLQQVFFEEGLRIDAEAALKGSVPTSSANGTGANSPNSQRSPNAAQKSQQALFEDGLAKEAEARARVVHLHGNTYQFQRTPSEVRKPNPNSQILINARGNPYVEGDPDMGYSSEDLRPRYTPQQFPLANVLKSGGTPHVFPEIAPNSKLQNNGNQTIRKPPFPTQHHQVKPKPKNWASLLQSQSPSMDMKLEFYPDLLRGKEDQVEIDIELTDVGKWNKYLVGHFLDGKMPYPLVASTARYQWKELFVAVKPDVGGCYLFEFRDEQAKQQVLDGGPYFFSQKYLVLKDWHRMMRPVKEQPSHIPAWVKLHNLPLELWNQECLSRVASTIGKPLHVDQATAKTSRQPGLLHTKSTNARICIEISAEHELPDDVRITVEGESVVVSIEYQVLPSLCKVCQVFGHSTDQCSKKPSPIISQPHQEWTVVGNGKIRTDLPYTNPCSTSTALPVSTKHEGDPQAELADSDDESEEELEKLLESIVRSSQENPILSQSTEQHPPLIPIVSSSYANEEPAQSLQGLIEQQEASELAVSSHNGSEEQLSNNKGSISFSQVVIPSPAAPTRSAAKKVANLAAKLRIQEPPDPGVPDIKLQKGGSSKAGQKGKQKRWGSSNKSGK